MHPRSAEYSLRTTSSSPVSRQPSIAGPSPSPSPAPRTPAAALTSIKETGTDIISAIEGWHKKTPTAQALADALRVSLAKHEGPLRTAEASNTPTFDSLQDLNNTLRDVQRAVNAEARPRKRHVAKGTMLKLFGVEQADIFSSCRIRVASAFQALELSLLATRSTAPTSTSQQGAGTSSVRGDTLAAPQAGWSDRAMVVLDTSETVFQFAVGIGEAMPLAGSALKAVGSIGQTIIKILKDVVNNKEEAKTLAKYVQDLIATAERFVENNGTQIGDETVAKLGAFEATLKAVRSELEAFTAQGGFRQGVSHLRNKEVLAGCDSQIRRSFTQLQVHLSLDTVRLLNNLGDADARRARRDLLDRLGDAETGATDKASDPADLMCLEGTRVELLDEVDTWASDPSSQRVLWINGVAGCGKSAIAATIAARREEQSATAIFHFSRSNQSRNKRVICSIARQLAQKVARGTERSPEHLVLSSVNANPDIVSAYLSTQFKVLIVDPLSKLIPGSPPVLIVIDALDEWDNQVAAAKLIDLIHEHDAKLPPSIKFILTSRKESHLSHAFSAREITRLVRPLALDIAPRAIVDQDIRAYLTKHFDRIRSRLSELPAGNWPGKKAIGKLVTLAGGLFQWASTVVRFVEEGGHNVRLNEILAKPNQFGDLDELYQHVLSTLLKKNKRTSISTLLQNILGSIVVAPTPISLDTLVYLHASDEDALEVTTSDIKEILSALGSLLIVPVLSNEPIRVLHPSIIDFLTDQQRCTDKRIYTDRGAQNRRLALLCLNRMRRDLKRDICGVGDPRRFNADPDVQELVSNHILDPLRYVCRYWAEHLLASGVENGVDVAATLQSFCTGHLLLWFEAMSLTKMFPQAVAAIKLAEKWVTLCPPGSTDSTLRALLHDARRFLLMYSEPIMANVAHIYLSALSTAPSGTNLAKAYTDYGRVGARVLAGPIAEYWPGSLWVADRHSDSVTLCVFSPDGTILASGSNDNTVRMWDVETGVQKGPTLEGHTWTMGDLAFTPDGRTLASGSSDSTLRLWDVDTGVQKGPALKEHTDSVACLAISSDGMTLVSGSYDSTLRLWDVGTGAQKEPTLEGHTNTVNCLAISSDGRTLASGSSDRTLRLWDPETGVQKGPALEGHTGSVGHLVFSSDGKALASGSSDHTLRLWDVETGVQRGSTLEGHTQRVSCLAFSSDSRTLASGSNDSTLRLWDPVTGVQKGATLKGHTFEVNCLAFSPDGKTLASCSGSDDNTVRLWDVDTGAQTGTLAGHTYWVICLAFSSNGKTLASGSADCTLRLWDMETSTQEDPTPQEHTDWVACLAFSSDGRILASGSGDKTVRLWDLKTGVQKGPTLEGHISRVTCLTFSSNGRTLVSGSSDKTLRLWDVDTGLQMGPTLKGHTSRIVRLAFSPDETILASGSRDNTLRMWDPETGVQKGPTLEGHTNWVACLSFSGDGRILASGSLDDTLRLWDVDTGLQKGETFTLPSTPSEVKFSVTGRQINVRFVEHPDLKLDVDMEACISPAAPGERASDGGFRPIETVIRIGQDGWVLYGTTRWFWLPVAYGRDFQGELRDDRFVFSHHHHVCIIDVSKIMYLIK